MQQRVGQAAVESVAAETPKFTAPMVMIHGLWCTAAAWHPFMGYFAHRGWRCHALTLRAHTDGTRATVGRVRFVDYVEDVKQVIAACDAPPVLVGHDVGGLLALHAGLPTVRAVVALAPLLPGSLSTAPNPLFSGFGARLAARSARSLAAPRGKFAARYFAQGVPGGTVPESGSVAQELRGHDLRIPLRSGIPALLVVGDDDPFCTKDDVARLVRNSRVQIQSVAGAGHALPWEQGWERRVSEIHRWLIHSLGDDLLAWRAEEDEP